MQNEYLVEQLSCYLSCHYSHSKVKESDFKGIAFLMLSLLYKTASHKLSPDYGLITSHTKKKLFSNRFTEINRELGFFVQVARHNQQRKIAAAWVLTPVAHALLIDFLAQRTLKELQESELKTKAGIMSRTNANGKTKHKFQVLQEVDLNQEKLNELMLAAKHYIDPNGNINLFPQLAYLFNHWDENSTKERIEFLLLQLGGLQFKAAANKSIHYRIDTVYTEYASGRLYARELNLQNVNGAIRRAALFGQMDIDIANCHWTILYQLAQQQGLELPTVAHYLQHKAQVRETIASDCGITVPQAKRCLIAIIYGASIDYESYLGQERNVTRIADVLGSIEAHERFKNHYLVQGLFDDVETAQHAIVDKFISDAPNGKQGYIINHFGKQFKVPVNKDSQFYREAIAHILQGVEASILNVIGTCFNEYVNDVTCLQHDGLTVRNDVTCEQLQEIEKQVQIKTGFNVILEAKKIEKLV